MSNKLVNALRGAAALALVVSVPTVSTAADLDILKVSGYIRQALQLNLSDANETAVNDRWDLSMSRTTVRVDMEAELPNVTFVGIFRASREVETNYLKRLNALKDANTQLFGGLAFALAGSPGTVPAGSLDLEEYYDTEDMRELYAEFDVTDRISVRVGKQQVAFGETDFFQANDILHGFDWTWRSFLETENEELRKPLTMVNATVQVPELSGKLQLIYGPGDINPNGAFGTELDIFGGRFAGQPDKGLSFLDTTITPYNYNHSKGDTDEDFWAVRWSGYSFDINYSLMYVRQVTPTPIVVGNPNLLPLVVNALSGGAVPVDPTETAFMNSGDIPFEGTTCAQGATGPACYGEIVYPFVNTYGGTASYYDAFTDAVYSTELSYIVDKPFQSGRFCSFCTGVSGFVGLARAIRKDEMSLMLRGDKLLYLSDYIGTHRASFLSIQVFNRWLPDFEKNDQLTVGPGFGQPKKRWETTATAILAMNYLNDRINPTLAFGYDVSYGSAFFIPSVNLVQGDAWRLLIEADLFFANDDRKSGETAANEQEDNIIGSFNQNNQLYIRLTRQF